MQFSGSQAKAIVWAAMFAVLTFTPALAYARTQQSITHHSAKGFSSVQNTALVHSSRKGTQRFAKNAKVSYTRYSGLQCVPFARAASGIELKGNAVNWWDAASGVYERGARPEAGSVLNFRSIGRMRLGHVAVVTNVVSAREVEIEHANWASPGSKGGAIARGIPVIDVSENNDWSAVRVGLGHSGDYGSVYPTYGFIYDRPDSGTMVANNNADITGAQVASNSPNPALVDEVAEAPASDGGAAAPVQAAARRLVNHMHVVHHRRHSPGNG